MSVFIKKDFRKTIKRKAIRGEISIPERGGMILLKGESIGSVVW